MSYEDNLDDDKARERNQVREIKALMEKMKKTVTTSGKVVVQDLIMKNINYVLRDKYEFIIYCISTI